MSSSAIPRLQVVIEGSAAPACVLGELKKATDLGFSELRSRIESGKPVLDVEMFTNDWFDGGAARILDLLVDWEAQGIDYILREALVERDRDVVDGETTRITVEMLRNIIRAQEEDRARIEELDDLRYRTEP